MQVVYNVQGRHSFLLMFLHILELDLLAYMLYKRCLTRSRFIRVGYCVLCCGIVWYGVVWYGVGVACYGIVLHGVMVWYSIVWYSIAWGKVWHGIVWCGLI